LGRRIVKVLLDSHAFIWWMSSVERLSEPAKTAIRESEVLVSAVTAYELGIKFALGRLPVFEVLEQQFEEACFEQGFELLPVSTMHALAAARLPIVHRDPFDRLLAAQSMVEEVPLVTVDAAFRHFGCKTVW
jgi:PIN domain nuclease of toxin-antitoxin system